jgi:D-alanine-D-alanine ligase-like ATP-grasp enzyme
LKICLLTDQDLSKPLEEGDFPCDPRPYLPEAEWHLGVLEEGWSIRQVMDLAQKGFDLFFNLCDAAWDESRPGIEVIQTLERLNVPFTGATSEFFEPSREAMKRVCHAWGIDTPGYVIAQEAEDVERALDSLRFPVIVKHPSSYASTGLTRDSRVTDAVGLRREAEIMIKEYQGALIEEFIDGGEATVLVAENPDDPRDPVAYVPVVYRFPPGETFKHYDLKWTDYHGLIAEPVKEDLLDQRLRRASSDFFLGLRGAGYGRCDLRIDAEGRPWMLEINPNPGVYYPPEDPGSADLILANSPGGHRAFTRQVVDAALARHARRQRGWEVRPQPGNGYAIYATRPFRPGETVMVFESTPHELVTLSHVEAAWEEPERTWFDRYAWPLTDEVWVTWSDDPMTWKPVNHGCEPSAWLQGLDVVARLPLEPGDEITLDYATIYNERMPDFACHCGAAACRGVIRGTDYLEPFVDRYQGHVTDWVARERAARHSVRRRKAGSP